VDNGVCGTDSTLTCTKDVTVSLRIPTNAGLSYGNLSTSSETRVTIRMSRGMAVSVDGKIVVPPYVRRKYLHTCVIPNSGVI